MGPELVVPGEEAHAEAFGGIALAEEPSGELSWVRTALMLAVEHKSTQIAELLLHCGVNVSASDNCGEIALSYAIASGNTANRNLILQYMKAQSRTSVNFNPVKESPKDDSLRRSIKKSHSDDSLFAMVGGSYEAHIKNIPEKGGEFIEASRQSMKDEVKYDTGNQKSGNLPDKSKPSSQKKEILETTLVQAIRIKNDCLSIPSPESKAHLIETHLSLYPLDDHVTMTTAFQSSLEICVSVSFVDRA
uniref:uncharacterized protein LOC143388965 n=1 Tax=Callospermophilus lateralis TaxID=76772 RepID=UPI004038D06E